MASRAISPEPLWSLGAALKNTPDLHSSIESLQVSNIVGISIQCTIPASIPAWDGGSGNGNSGQLKWKCWNERVTLVKCSQTSPGDVRRISGWFAASSPENLGFFWEFAPLRSAKIGRYWAFPNSRKGPPVCYFLKLGSIISKSKTRNGCGMRFSHVITISIISWDMSIQDLPVPCWMATLQSNMATGHPL